MPLISLAQVTSPLVLEAHSYWASKRQDGRLPSRADIDPLDIPSLLPYVLLSEISLSPFQVRYRLMGTEAAAMNNLDLTGKTLNYNIDSPTWQRYWEKAYLMAASHRQPVFGIDSYEYRDRAYLCFEWCLLPLATDGLQVDRFLEIEALPGARRRGEAASAQPAC
ncbi:MAG TPA: PAS domain-containing protein [Kiloniellales bacterium]|nr:PAS domain-containing protein [Kiloniellales bacterium]